MTVALIGFGWIVAGIAMVGLYNLAKNITRHLAKRRHPCKPRR